jgi:hypothetical protein
MPHARGLPAICQIDFTARTTSTPETPFIGIRDRPRSIHSHAAHQEAHVMTTPAAQETRQAIAI